MNTEQSHQQVVQQSIQKNNQQTSHPANNSPPNNICYPNNVAGYMRKSLKSDMRSFIASGQAKTGFTNLDGVIGKLYPGFYVLGAGSSLGKTTFILQIADQLVTDSEHVLFFTFEMSQMELVSKIISRRTVLQCRANLQLAKTALQIRKGEINQAVKHAANGFLKDADIFTIIEGNFSTDMTEIERIVGDYVSSTGVVPIIMIDYLQVIQEDSQSSDKAKIDLITKRLKILQRKLNCVMICISSINRSNYMLEFDFESLKESGIIEYSADVVWGLQLQILNDNSFMNTKSISQKRRLISMAKAESPRKIELKCIKNRYGIASYSCGFLYYPQFDLFIPDKNYKQSALVIPTPQKITI